MTIAITGLGAVSCLGRGARAIGDALAEGRDGITEMERIDLRAIHPVRLAGWMRAAWEAGEPADAEVWAIEAAREAWAHAGLHHAPIDPARIAVVAGTTDGEHSAIAQLADRVASALGAAGPRWTISTACASSANALGLARDLILAGDADVVIAGGAERLRPEMFAGFAALGVLSAEPCAPFGEVSGTTLGEGAGFVVLERAGARAVEPTCFLAGYGLSSDAWHETTPEPRGEGIARAMRGCLADAGIEPGEVDYVNAHGTGTLANDDAEWRGIQRALGPRAAGIPISSSKGLLGHAQGAAGVLETIGTILSMGDGTIPPSVRIGRGRPRGPADAVAEGRARPGAIGVALSNSAAFGGANAVVAITRRARPATGRPERRVWLAGSGRAITAEGETRDEAALARTIGDLDVRQSDPSARMLLAATIRALDHASLRLRGPLRDRAGAFTGAARVSPASADEFQASLARGGLGRASAPAFARLVMHAPTGAVSRLLALRGPTTSIAADGVAGMLAVALAARSLRDREDADVLIAAGLHERAVAGDGVEEDRGEEGAAVLVLRADAPSMVRVAGVALAGPGRLEDATARALTGAATTVVEHTVHAGDPGALRSTLAVAQGAAAVREGARAVLVTGDSVHGSIAMVLMREDG